MIHKYTNNIVGLYELYFQKYTEMISELVNERESREAGLVFENIRLVYALGKIIIFNFFDPFW